MNMLPEHAAPAGNDDFHFVPRTIPNAFD